MDTRKKEAFLRYVKILDEEYELRRPDSSYETVMQQNFATLKRPEKVYKMVWRIFEVAKSSFVSRSYNSHYNICNDEIVYESVGAHTNLMLFITTSAIDFCYGHGFGGDACKYGRTIEGYTYREIIEAAQMHDLAENVFGDIPDNGAHDEATKNANEIEYFSRFFNSYQIDKEETENVLELLKDMQSHITTTGKLLYLADKTSALLITLWLDHMGRSPLMQQDSDLASPRDLAEMKMCDFVSNHSCRASEMWAIDFFKMRKIVDLDETFFFTALIIMATLIVHGRWYSWREKDYHL